MLGFEDRVRWKELLMREYFPLPVARRRHGRTRNLDGIQRGNPQGAQYL